MTKLKSCPFCGGEAGHFGGGGQHCVRCSRCGITNERIKAGDTHYEAYSTTAKAIDAWNRRPEPRQLTLDELRRMEGPVWICYQQETQGPHVLKRGSLACTRYKFSFSTYGKTWFAYDRPPGGEK